MFRFNFIHIEHMIVHIIISGCHDVFFMGTIQRFIHISLSMKTSLIPLAIQVEFAPRLSVLLHFRRNPPRKALAKNHRTVPGRWYSVVEKCCPGIDFLFRTSAFVVSVWTVFIFGPSKNIISIKYLSTLLAVHACRNGSLQKTETCACSLIYSK